VTVVSGFFYTGFEVSKFRPIGSNERWWLDGPDSFWHAYTAAVGTDTSRFESYFDTVFIRVRGRRSSKGRHGHKGGFNRHFEVSTLYEMRRLTRDEWTTFYGELIPYEQYLFHHGERPNPQIDRTGS